MIDGNIGSAMIEPRKRSVKEVGAMQISLLLMQEIVKLFVIMLMGYAVVKAGLMKASDSRSISVVLVYLVIPCVIIHAF